MLAGTIVERLNVTPEEAETVLKIIRGQLDPLTGNFPKTREWYMRCYNRPRKSEIKLEALNELLCGCGVEAVTHEFIYVDSYYGNIVGSYVNFGDTYANTILLDHINNKWKITSWGDFFESLDQYVDADEKEEE
ncbi:MAG: hypothetical protein ACK45I_03080 [Bacteroidota bacterium]|jgi:hypothetical protein